MVTLPLTLVVPLASPTLSLPFHLSLSVPQFQVSNLTSRLKARTTLRHLRLKDRCHWWRVCRCLCWQCHWLKRCQCLPWYWCRMDFRRFLLGRPGGRSRWSWGILFSLQFSRLMHCSFQVKEGTLTFSVVIFCVEAFIAICVLLFRRRYGGELGGPRGLKIASSLFFVFLWILYLALSTAKAYCLM